MEKEEYEAMSELAEKKGVRKDPIVYSFGKPIGDTRVIYWGQEKTIKGDRTAMCVCPECGELWRAKLYAVANKKITHCGCVKGKSKSV